MQIKLKFIPIIIAIGISLLIGYGFYAANANEWQRWLMFGIASFEFAVLFGAGFGIKYSEHGGVNVTVLSIVFAMIELIVQLISTFTIFRLPPYIIVNGILLLIFIGITYALAHALND